LFLTAPFACWLAHEAEANPAWHAGWWHQAQQSAQQQLQLSDDYLPPQRIWKFTTIKPSSSHNIVTMSRCVAAFCKTLALHLNRLAAKSGQQTRPFCSVLTA
jgi:hypothetical protein